MAQFDTVATLVGDVAKEVGLGAVTVSYTSQDANVIQLLAILKKMGRTLVMRYRWLQNTKEYNFTTTSATTYALPSDFLSLVDLTAWDRTSDLSLAPATPQQWQQLKASNSTPLTAIVYRINHVSSTGAPQLESLGEPPSGATVALEYKSRLWVATSDVTAVTLDAPTATTDVVRLEAALVTAGLKVGFLRAKGFDSAAATEEFEDIFEASQSAAAGASPELTIGGSGGWSPLGERLAPHSGYGSVLDLGGLF